MGNKEVTGVNSVGFQIIYKTREAIGEEEGEERDQQKRRK